MGYISVRNAHKEFMKDGEPLTILEDINLDIEKGEFICLLGPSGSGKSTLLNAIAGFELVTSGSITIDGEEVKAPIILASCDFSTAKTAAYHCLDTLCT